MPLFLFFIGGLVGGIIAGASIFTNSILLRKINNKILSYLMAGLNLFFACIIYFRIVGFIIPLFFRPPIDQQLMSFASEINKSCPFMVDKETRLDNTIAGGENSIIYNYTLINYNKDQVRLDYFRDKLKSSILNVIKTSPEMQYLRDYDVTFIYNYKDKSGIFITSFKYTAKDYK